QNFLRDTFNNEIFVSYVTAWEIAIKYGIGKLQTPDIPEIWVPDRIRRAGFLQLPIEMRHALRVHNLPPIHKDPFDRLLISQANEENLTIITEDPNFTKYQVKTKRLSDL
ncbi:MAG TPA: type II toxin-antitoxin system VapC family toxin, partial [Pyrinomonadaceae bacterium]|nr:type II toxin-antitoxin system VapC family toxin [Pyrinomonadaceae bacterium]